MSDATTLQARALSVLDLDDLREHILPPTALLMVIADALAVWLYLPADNYQWRQSLLLVSAGVVSFAVWLFGRKRPLIGALALVLTQYFLAPVTAALLPGAEVFLLCLATVSAIALAWPAALLVAAAGAVLCQLAIHFWLQSSPHLDLAILTYCLIGGWLFFSAHSYQGILHWSWQRHANALNLSEQLRDRQGQLNSTVKALDLAYRLLQRTNHELAEAREEAEEARHLKEQFAANISHELRTPLNLIMGFSEMMHLSPHVYGDVNWTTPLRRDIAQLYTASRHLLQLVDDVLDLSRLNAERMPLRKELCSLSDIVNEAVATVRDLVRGRPLSIHAELDPTVPRLLLDGTRIRQALLNLLNNAIRFTDQGEIAVQTERRDHEVLISISDTGIGIPEEELENIFDEFYQTEAAVRKGSGGMGLGLAISKRFVQLHGGRIWADSTLGSGSTFYISLPLDASRPVASRLRMSSAASIPSNPYAESVLLLSGQIDVARMLARHLSGYKVLCAADAGEAQRLMEEHHPRAAICN
ncbi:MAG: sensor histidine kinase, partial [Anaerolineae bacterium]